MAFVTLDEHPDSINDGWYANDLDANYWLDVPASHHNGAGGFSFADGHSEIHKWLSAKTVRPVRFSSTWVEIALDSRGKQDFQWVENRCQYVPLR